ncbi:MAG: histidinol-phosphatase [Pirellulales bacterium]|nr:histidinol-phosphatase [Pirellulales bacterium]
MPPLASRLDFAVHAARAAGDVTLQYFRRDDLAVELKADDSPVTAADRQAETELRRLIAESFPDDGILGEEMPEREGKSGYRWILDPIDGTKSFIHGVPLYGTLIGLEREGESVLGVIRIPALDECVYAANGQGAWYVRGDRPPEPARVSNCRSLKDALFVTSEVASFDITHRRRAYDRMQAAARLTRTWGDCYGYLLVATGRADVMIDPIMCVWDAAPMLPILQEAGGAFTDWKGRPTIHAGEGAATNGLLLEEVLRALET